MTNKSHPDRVIAAIADRQHGVIAADQLALSRPAIKHRVSTGRLHRRYQGVYAVGRRRLTREGEWMAAVLAYGTGAVLSHQSAGALWGLISGGGSKIHVTTPDARRSRAGIRHHRAPLHEHEVMRVNGIPATSLARTIYDLASCLAGPRLAKVVEAADRRDLLELDALDRAVARRPRARGVKRLQAVLADYRLPADTRSPLEDEFMDLVRRAGLPPPQANTLVEGFTVDCYWPQWRLVVELDGRGYHSSPRVFESDRVKDTVLQKSGRRVMRVTRKRLRSQPQQVLEDIYTLRQLPGSPPAERPPP